MLLSDLFEEQNKLLAVIYGGRFQPFHRGHLAAYKQACEWFGEKRVWIATSNKTNFNPANGDVSPFDFAEKAELMVDLYNIDSARIVKCKNPAFSPVEVLSKYKAPTVCVMLVGAKDVDRYRGSSMFKRYPVKEGVPVPFEQCKNKLELVNGEQPVMYYLVSDAHAGEVSGTKIREVLGRAPESAIPGHFKKFFGKHDSDIEEMIMSKIKLIKEEPKKKKAEDKSDEVVDKQAAAEKPTKKPKKEPKLEEPVLEDARPVKKNKLFMDFDAFKAAVNKYTHDVVCGDFTWNEDDDIPSEGPAVISDHGILLSGKQHTFKQKNEKRVIIVWQFETNPDQVEIFPDTAAGYDRALNALKNLELA